MVNLIINNEKLDIHTVEHMAENESRADFADYVEPFLLELCKAARSTPTTDNVIKVGIL